MSQMPLDLSATGVAKYVARQINEAIDGYAICAYSDGPRKHLGASVIGHPCLRYQWLLFRWTVEEQFSGRMMRLFNRGHREEPRFVEFLQGIGARLEMPTQDIQMRVADVMGHFGGSLDNITYLPERFRVQQPLLTEFKTNGTGSGFQKLIKEGVILAKPRHYAQMNVYGRLMNLSHGLYMCVNKNDDDLHVEVVPLNHANGDENIRKARHIIEAREPPPRIAENPQYKDCRMCGIADKCWNNTPSLKNCRSCRSSRPIENKQWFCERWNASIPEDAIAAGCDAWEDVTQ